MNLSELFGIEALVLKLTEDEALCIDWVLTLHAWDEALYDRLKSIEMSQLHENVGMVVLGRWNAIEVSDEQLQWLLLTVRWDFCVGEKRTGLNLKRKLYELLLGPAAEEEAKNVGANEAYNAAQTHDLS